MRNVSLPALMSGSPTASAAIFTAADRYFSCSDGETPSTSEMLSKPYAESSGGRSEVTSTSSASRSRTAFGVLAAIQAMQNRRARIGMGGRRGIETRFERGLQPRERRFVRPPGSLRRHGARLQLAHDFLPHIWMRSGRGAVQPFERQAGGVQALVVTGDAVPIENGTIGRTGRSVGKDLRRGRLRHGQRRYRHEPRGR